MRYSDLIEAKSKASGYRVGIGTRDADALRAIRKALSKRFGRDAFTAPDEVILPSDAFDTVKDLVGQFPKTFVRAFDRTQPFGGEKTIYWQPVGWFPIFKDGGYFPNPEKNQELGWVEPQGRPKPVLGLSAEPRDK
jgi:hypothetical protein